MWRTQLTASNMRFAEAQEEIKSRRKKVLNYAKNENENCGEKWQIVV